MVTVDYLLAAVFLLSALMGLFRGLVKEALSLVGWILAVWCSWRFGAAVAERIPSVVDDSIIETWVARVIVLIVVLILSGLLGRLIAHLVHQSGLSGTDRMIGMVFGMARGVVLVGVVVLMLDAVGFDADPWWQESKLIPYAAPLAERFGDIAGDGVELIREKVDGVPLPL
jgi:membrane protein required for colicin V production